MDENVGFVAAVLFCVVVTFAFALGEPAKSGAKTGGVAYLVAACVVALNRFELPHWVFVAAQPVFVATGAFVATKLTAEPTR